MKPFRSFWVKYKNVSGSITVIAQGAKAGLKTGHWLEFPLNKGWNFIANPFPDGSVPFDKNHIRIRWGEEGSDLKNVSDAKRVGWSIRSALAASGCSGTLSRHWEN